MRIVITGGTGSLGTSLCEKWHQEHDLTIISRDDHKQAAARALFPTAVFHSLDIGNAGNFARMLDIFDGQNLIVHTAAQKQVGEGQYQPFAYLTTNVLGTMYLLQAWKQTHLDCRRFLFISSDKAVAGLNLYGKSKAVAESLVRAEGYDGTVIRYGNVVTSKGGLFDAWKACRDSGQPIIVKTARPTNESPTRFFLTMEWAVSLVEQAIGIIEANAGDEVSSMMPGVYVPGSLPAFDVMDVAKSTGLPIKEMPLEPFEKVHEVLLAPGEGFMDTGGSLGRVVAPFNPLDEFYKPFRSNTAWRMSGRQILDRVGWNDGE